MEWVAAIVVVMILAGKIYIGSDPERYRRAWFAVLTRNRG